MAEKTKIIAVGGATASGKSSLAIELCRALGGELVSCDSMQIYRGMDIGTAKPTDAEMKEILHHMIDVCDPRDDYSAADWATGAGAAIEDICSRGKLPVICGGTGMYLDALLRPSAFTADVGAERVAQIRRELQVFAEERGAEALYRRLYDIDPEAAEATHPNNVKRVARALEIYYTTGVTKTESDKRTLLGESTYDCTVVTLDYSDRNILYGRIDGRVDIMMSDGLEREVRELYADGALIRGTTAAQAIGYKELLDYIDGEVTLEGAVELIKRNTRRYAKRQLTWFKRYDRISLTPDADGRLRSTDELLEELIVAAGMRK